MQFTTASLALLGLASAAPTLKTRTTSTSPTFNLMYQSVGNAPEPVDALNKGTWYVSASNGKAVLSSYASRGLLYKYGTGPRIAQASVGLTITPGGTATVPSGKPIEFVNNNGTAPVDIHLNASGVPTLWYDGGHFQACKGDGEEIYLSYVQPGQRFLAACAAVELQSVCSTSGTGEPMKGQLGAIQDVACVELSI
ncbi:hypothetical protein SLS60_010847 [Paraconiothyrium brasiliense]|uniref:Cell wall protein PhiA n=1 Tax=Paraconiothyrium brasiliense TaxID=300254 RepID=A0ABR3QM60_9PLEO